jgi:dTDP-4-amino-4,6-dideoxygalactose transaminase
MPEEISVPSIGPINAKRNEWMDDLQKSGISSRPATHAVHMLSFYKEKYNLRPTDFPNAYAADHCSISLPLFHGMKENEQDFVIEKVLDFKK